MKVYALKRLLISIPLVFVMTFVVFCVINLTAANHFATFIQDEGVDPQVIEIEARRLHMHEPVPVRFVYWLRGVLFDLRLSQERRYLATFEDNDPSRGNDKYKFGGSTAASPLPDGTGEFAVGGDHGAPLGRLATSNGVLSVLDPKNVRAVRFTASAPVPEGLALVVIAGSGPIAFPFVPQKDGTAVLALDVDTLATRAALDQIRSIEIDAAKPGTAKVQAELLSRAIWQEAYPGKLLKRTIQVTYPGREGHFAELGSLKSPYVSKTVKGVDWKADWTARQAKSDEKWAKSVKGWEEAGKRGPAPEKPVLEKIHFDALEFDGRALQGGPLKVEVQLICAEGEEPDGEPAGETPVEVAKVPVKVGEVTLGPDTQRFQILFRDFPPQANLRRVYGLRLASSANGRAEFDDFRLRVDQSPVGAGLPNFGESWAKKKSVISLIAEKVKNTIVLNLWALFFTWLIALPAGIYGAVRQYTTGDKLISFMTFIGMAMPSFFLAMLVVFLVTLTYEIPSSSPFHFLNGLLPIAGRTSQNHSEMTFVQQLGDVLKHMILPGLVVVLGGLGSLQRIVRSTMLEEKRKLYVTTAMAKGLPPRQVLFKHALRNAIIPFVASAGSLLPAMIGGSAFIEIIFDYPGIGRQMYDSVLGYDVPVVMANTLIVGLLLVIGNLLSDFALAWVDPRISLEA